MNIKSNEQIRDECEEELREMCDYYLKQMKQCPNCKSDNYVSYNVIGLPTDELIELEEKTEIIILVGCCIEPDQKDLFCRKCNQEFFNNKLF